MAEKVTVDLATHWPCVTDLSGLSTYGLNGLLSKMSTTPSLQKELGWLYLFLRIMAL